MDTIEKHEFQWTDIFGGLVNKSADSLKIWSAGAQDPLKIFKISSPVIDENQCLFVLKTLQSTGNC